MLPKVTHYPPEPSDDLIPEGEHEATLERIVEDASRSTGEPMFKWIFQVDDERHEDVVTITALTPQQEKGSSWGWRLAKMLDEFGGKYEDIDLNDLPGTRCIVKVAHETYNRQVNPKVTDVKRVLGRDPNWTPPREPGEEEEQSGGESESDDPLRGV